MRPNKIEEFFGQEHLFEQGVFFQDLVEKRNLSSMVFWGPPGSGKTTLANIVSNSFEADFHRLSGVTSGVEDLRKVINKAKENKNLNATTILFLDEIHRWNKAQQDALLPWIENGTIVLIGATTENPSFSLNNALLSRLRVLVLEELSEKSIKDILSRALEDKENGYGDTEFKIEDGVLDLVARMSNGDARIALNTLEFCLGQNKEISKEMAKQIMHKIFLKYDKHGDEHFNVISALHKSMRGGDADAASYWVVRMLEGGEDPLYIARRLIRFASEDVGLADNFALILANGVYDTCKKIGMPECAVAVLQCVIYLTKTKKNILAYQVFNMVKKDIEKYGNLPVPMHIRNAPTKLMKELGYGKEYKYTPLDGKTDQSYLPEKIKNKKYIY